VTPGTALKPRETEALERLLVMHDGYVLKYTTPQFTRIMRELGVAIDSVDYADDGNSKAKRLRTFYRKADPKLVGRALRGLIDRALDDGQLERRTADLRVLERAFRRLVPDDYSIDDATRELVSRVYAQQKLSWSGGVDTRVFIERAFDPSEHPRFRPLLSEADGRDWNFDEHWIFEPMPCLELAAVPDDLYAAFLSATVHPAVQLKAEHQRRLVTALNEVLEPCGWRLSVTGSEAGRHVYTALRGAALSVALTAGGREVLSREYLEELDRKVSERLRADELDAAITVSRTMLEAVLDELELKLSGEATEHHGELSRQYKSVAKQLGIDAGRKDLDDAFKKVCTGLVNVVDGLATVRNKMSDAHARKTKPSPHHALVIANASRTVASFLIESYLYQRSRGKLSGGSRERKA